MGEPIIVALGCEARGDTLFCTLLMAHPSTQPGAYTLQNDEHAFTIEMPPGILKDAARLTAVEARLRIIGGTT